MLSLSQPSLLASASSIVVVYVCGYQVIRVCLARLLSLKAYCYDVMYVL